LDLDRPDARMRVHRPDDDRIALARKVDVVLKASFPAEQALVLEACDGLTDPVLSHQDRALSYVSPFMSRLLSIRPSEDQCCSSPAVQSYASWIRDSSSRTDGGPAATVRPSSST